MGIQKRRIQKEEDEIGNGSRVGAFRDALRLVRGFWILSSGFFFWVPGSEFWVLRQVPVLTPTPGPS